VALRGPCRLPVLVRRSRVDPRRRIAEREEKPVDRRESGDRAPRGLEKKRYREYYDIDIGDLSIYDAAYNTARWGPERFIDVLVATIDVRPATDEGKAPIEGVSYDF